MRTMRTLHCWKMLGAVQYVTSMKRHRMLGANWTATFCGGEMRYRSCCSKLAPVLQLATKVLLFLCQQTKRDQTKNGRAICALSQMRRAKLSAKCAVSKRRRRASNEKSYYAHGVVRFIAWKFS